MDVHEVCWIVYCSDTVFMAFTNEQRLLFPSSRNNTVIAAHETWIGVVCSLPEVFQMKRRRGLKHVIRGLGTEQSNIAQVRKVKMNLRHFHTTEWLQSR